MLNKCPQISSYMDLYILVNLSCMFIVLWKKKNSWRWNGAYMDQRDVTLVLKKKSGWTEFGYVIMSLFKTFWQQLFEERLLPSYYKAISVSRSWFQGQLLCFNYLMSNHYIVRFKLFMGEMLCPKYLKLYKC